MKADTHPDYHFITVTMTDGTSYQTRSTYQKEGAVLNLDHLFYSEAQGGMVAVFHDHTGYFPTLARFTPPSATVNERSSGVVPA